MLLKTDAWQKQRQKQGQKQGKALLVVAGCLLFASLGKPCAAKSGQHVFACQTQAENAQNRARCSAKAGDLPTVTLAELHPTQAVVGA